MIYHGPQRESLPPPPKPHEWPEPEVLCCLVSANGSSTDSADSAIRRWGGTSAVLRSAVNAGYRLGSVSA
jgi:hypothetical protein